MVSDSLNSDIRISDILISDILISDIQISDILISDFLISDILPGQIITAHSVHTMYIKKTCKWVQRNVPRVKIFFLIAAIETAYNSTVETY